MGSGLYSDKLPYKNWVLFNNAVRAHQNIVEQIHFLLVFFLVCGLVLPKIMLILSWLGVAGRIFYVIGYVKKGPNGRMVGAFMNLIPNYFIVLIVLGVLIKVAVIDNGIYIGMPSSIQAVKV